jgi:hypothetical protein
LLKTPRTGQATWEVDQRCFNAAAYFTDPHAAAVETHKQLAYWRPRGVYVTLNPVDAGHVGRSTGCFTPWLHPITSDAEIVRRRWLYVDIDPIRTADTNSTEAELQLAHDRAEAISEWLRASHGWGEPVTAASGNGDHLLWPVDLPNDAASLELVSHILKAIAAQHDDGAAKVDHRVKNAARIIRLYGTPARKGPHSNERPHRVAELLHVPDYLANGWAEPLTTGQLQALAAIAPADPPSTPRNGCPVVADVAVSDRIRRARAYLAKADPAIQGQNGSAIAYRLASRTALRVASSADSHSPKTMRSPRWLNGIGAASRRGPKASCITSWKTRTRRLKRNRAIC